MNSLLANKNNLKLTSVDDAMELISSGLPGCVFTLDDLGENFFDLRNGIAGEVFQKLVNYNFRTAIVFPPSHTLGIRITELVRDHTHHPCIRFFESEEDAIGWLS